MFALRVAAALLLAARVSTFGPSPKPAQKTERLWYNLNFGACNIEKADATSVQMTPVSISSALLFAAAPYQEVILPADPTPFLDLDAFEDGMVTFVAHLEDGRALGYIGVMKDGVITGESIYPSDDITEGPVVATECVLGHVKKIEEVSAAARGTCTSDGSGEVSIEIDPNALRIFQQEDFNLGLTYDPAELMNMFVGYNAVAFAEGSKGLYDVFNITSASDTHMTGNVYFSTRARTFATDQLGQGTEYSSACNILVDPFFFFRARFPPIRRVPSPPPAPTAAPTAAPFCRYTGYYNMRGENFSDPKWITGCFDFTPAPTVRPT